MRCAVRRRRRCESGETCPVSIARVNKWGSKSDQQAADAQGELAPTNGLQLRHLGSPLLVNSTIADLLGGLQIAAHPRWPPPSRCLLKPAFIPHQYAGLSSAFTHVHLPGMVSIASPVRDCPSHPSGCESSRGAAIASCEIGWNPTLE